MEYEIFDIKLPFNCLILEYLKSNYRIFFTIPELINCSMAI